MQSAARSDQFGFTSLSKPFGFLLALNSFLIALKDHSSGTGSGPPKYLPLHLMRRAHPDMVPLIIPNLITLSIKYEEHDGI